MTKSTWKIVKLDWKTHRFFSSKRVGRFGKEAYSSLCYKHSTATWTHVPYGITQCYLPSAEVTFPPLPQPVKAGTRFSDPRGMQGWVDLVGLVGYIPRWYAHPKMVTHPSTNRDQCWATLFVQERRYHSVKPPTGNSVIGGGKSIISLKRHSSLFDNFSPG